MAGLLAAATLNSTFSGNRILADELGRPPAALSIDEDARPIELANRSRASLSDRVQRASAQWSGDRPAAPSSNTPLRWRTPSQVPANPAQLAGQKSSTVTRAVWKEAGRNSVVQTAGQQLPHDPFDEPAPTPMQLSPNQNSQVPGRDPRDDPFSEFPSQPAQPSAPSDAPQPALPDLQLPQDPGTPLPERELAPVPPFGFGTPDPLLGPVRDDKPCDRTYNDRNCCADDAKCRQAQQFVAQYKITSILLDITPSFTNTESATSPNYVPTEVRKEQELAKAPSRAWKNRAGETVAEGRFNDYHNGLIHVLGSDGEIARIPFNTLSDDDVCFVTAWWSLPTECSLSDEKYHPRDWLASTLTWKASSLCHKPLYFEEVALERYGHSVGPLKQPFVSGAHFFGSLAALPYQMGIHPPNECQYALGYYRPGSCAPWLMPPMPLSLRGALAEAGAWVGGVYIVP